MWLSHPSFMQMVEYSWNIQLNIAPPFLFTAKLKRLKEVLNIWNRTVFGEVQFHLKQAELKLETENDLLDFDHGSELQFVKVADAQKAVDDVRKELAVMLKMNSRDEIKDYIVNHYQAKFNGGDVNIHPRLFDIEHESISAVESAFMDAIPTLEEVKEVVFDLGADFAPGLDGFTVLIPKKNKSDAIKDYRPIGLSNFFFKIITKILATRLGTMLNKLISEEQVAFMKGRNIHENITLASELVNEIGTERKHGNVGLKLDITQAFDTVSWEFITEVFSQYGFSKNWCSWILNILNSARISVMINGSHEGFFSISRGLRQGDPLPPLIFVLIEDVLSRNLSKLFARRSMHSMVSKKGVSPTHLLFADDILIFYRGNLHSLQNLKDMLGMYQCSSGQYVSYAKSKFYYGGGTGSRAISIGNNLRMERSFFPDKYFGIQLNPGVVRHIHVRQVVEKIMDKLAGWKGKLLYFQARLVLIRSAISSYVLHSMDIYKWPCTVIKQVERVIRNFMWSGDAEKLKDQLVYNFVQKHTRLIIGNGANNFLSFDNWCGDFSIAKRLGIFSKGPNDFTAKVSDIIVDGAWAIPPRLRDLMIRCNIDIKNLPLIDGGDDYKIWDLDNKGVFSVKSAKAATKAAAEVLPIASLFTREINFSADALAKQAYLLAEDIFEFYEGRPGFILSVEWPGEPGSLDSDAAMYTLSYDKTSSTLGMSEADKID
ncbi:uncharacterized protein LOC113272958 [Papaver somniferum]|uniref:uncharacterized protein LOC113272958 n=1 Tax=Papaver somniferum TaxID=3469 RepID=UPI000E6FD61E|nr:uncharacterized protein LOC113272958 [Papaver somniferum]